MSGEVPEPTGEEPVTDIVIKDEDVSVESKTLTEQAHGDSTTELQQKEGEAPNSTLVPYQETTKPAEELNNEMIPEELLFALTNSNFQRGKKSEQLAPIKDLRTPKNLRVCCQKGPPANVWNHKARRTQFKHLTDFPRSLGKGFGTRDISFLYDVSQQHPQPMPPSKLDKSAVRLQAAQSGEGTRITKLTVPDTVIPEEYHIVKTKAVQGLEYIDEKQTTLISDTEKSLRIFPSLRPTKRFEVIQLLKTLDTMLEESGVLDQAVEVKGPTQIHNLLELIKKEQDIYDLVFNEVIRQVSVECLERGQLLSQLRQKYADLLNRIPRQIKSLHAEVMAQRSLDRRLTEELMRFKASISFLTKELQTVREHDQQVTFDAETAEAELAKALQESQMNANLVDEYHDLYELQRRRLEASVSILTMERDLWSNAAYDLAMKITTANSLNTAKRLHVSEKAWSKLANHFTVMLSDHDSDCLTKLQKHVEKWREVMFQFSQDLDGADRRSVNLLIKIREGLKNWISKFDDCLISAVADVRSIKIPPDSFVMGLCSNLKEWEEQLAEDGERYAGAMLLANEEKINFMVYQSEMWTEVALDIYRRHKQENDQPFPLAETMSEVNSMFQALVKQLQIRITGENGVARGTINIQNGFDGWVNKLTMLEHNSSDSLSDTEWLNLYDRLGEYLNVVNEIMDLMGSQQRDEDRIHGLPHNRINIEVMMTAVQEWMKGTLNQIEAEDGKMMAQVSSIHIDLVQWMVQMLLHLVPNYEERESSVPVEASLTSAWTMDELVERAHLISDHMSSFTEYFCQCCSGIVQSSMQEKKDQGEEDADHDYRDFLRVKREAKEWIRTCEFLLSSILPHRENLFNKDILSRLQLPEDSQRKSREEKRAQESAKRSRKSSLRRQSGSAAASPKLIKQDSKELAVEEVDSKTTTEKKTEEGKEEDTKESETKAATATDDEDEAGKDKEGGKEKPEEEETESKVRLDTKGREGSETLSARSKQSIQVLGDDDNIQITQLESIDVADGDAYDLPHPSSSIMQAAYDAIAKMDTIQKQLLATEVRAQAAEQRTIDLQEELNSSYERIRALEKLVAAADVNVEDSSKSGQAESNTNVLEKDERSSSAEKIGEKASKKSSQSDTAKKAAQAKTASKPKPKPPPPAKKK